MSDFFTYWIPWWVWALIGAGGIALVWRYLGTKGVAIAVTLLMGFLTYRKGQQAGWSDREGKENRDDLKNLERGIEAGRDADRDNRTGGLRRDDGYRRD